MKRNIEHVGHYMACKASITNAALTAKDCPACAWFRHTHELLGMGMALRSMGFDVQYEWDDIGLITAVNVDGLRFPAPVLMPL